MIVELTRDQAPHLTELFSYTEETLIPSYTQGHFGRGWADKVPNPTCGRISVGDLSFFAGDHTGPAARELLKSVEKPTLAVPQNKGWGALIEEMWDENTQKFTRYAIKKEPDCFDRKKLEGFVRALPEGYTLRQIDSELYHMTLQKPQTRDMCSNFSSEEDFLKRGLGFCVMLGGEIAAGASSYTMYDGGIEIEIVTMEEHRRKGLATACGARLILECLDRGLYPSWDAANKESVALSEKLGYHFDFAYDAYIVKPLEEA